MLPEAPVPVSGTFAPATGVLLLLFSLPLRTGILDERDWALRADGTTWDAIDVQVEHPLIATVRGSFVRADVEAGLPIVTCTCAIGDLVGRNGIPVAPFAGFPLTLV